MKHLKYFITGLIISIASLSFADVTDTVFYEFWDISSLTTIGGYSMTVYGEPSVVATEKGNAVQFDGINDALIIDKNPFGDTKEFTFEVLFKPNGGQPNIDNEPRFVCFWDPNDANGPRMTIEIRVTVSNEWYFDGYLKTDKENLTLIDETKTHPTGQWMHAAVTYKDNVFTTYVNGQQELSGTVGYTSKVFNTTGKTSVGARYNLTRWYNGSIRAIKATRGVLTPAEFFSIPDTNVTVEGNLALEGSTLDIYPVPANNQLCLRNFTDSALPLSVSVTSLTGLVVYQSSLTVDNAITSPVLDVSCLPNGVYFVCLQYQDCCAIRKICILH